MCGLADCASYPNLDIKWSKFNYILKIIFYNNNKFNNIKIKFYIKLEKNFKIYQKIK